jgi:cytochrome c553
VRSAGCAGIAILVAKFGGPKPRAIFAEDFAKGAWECLSIPHRRRPILESMKKVIFCGLVVGALLAAGPNLFADAAANWTADCAACHGSDGAGHTKVGRMVKVTDLTDAAIQKSFSDEVAFADIKGGLTKDGVIQMKPFKDKLSDAEIKALVAYVRTLAK